MWNLYLDANDNHGPYATNYITVDFSIKLSSHQMKNFNVKLVTSQVLNRTLIDASTHSPTHHLTHYPSTQNSAYAESTLPIPYKILIDVLIILFVFLSFMIISYSTSTCN